MDTRKAHHVWMEQCEAAHTIKSRFGVTNAFDYLVGEKLMTFANAAVDHPEFARELPRFVSEVRRMFTAVPWPKVSRIRDDEMRIFMKQVVDRFYTILLRLDDAEFVERIDNYARRMTRAWDAPKNLPDWFG